MNRVFRNAALTDGKTVDFAVSSGKIVGINPALENLENFSEHDLGGRLVLPGFFETHCHLDKTLTISKVRNSAGTLLEAIHNWHAFKPSLTKADYLERGTRALEWAIRQGTLALRTHVDVDAGRASNRFEARSAQDAKGLLALEAMLELRERFKDLITVQIVALGGPGLGGASFAAMVDALELGADLVGGCPAIRPDGGAEIEAALELAQRFGKGVDLHMDENMDPNSRWLEVLTNKVLERGFEGQVTAGHCCSLEFMAQSDAERVMDRVAEAKINIVTLPACNLVLQGRGIHPAPRGITRVKELLERGVNVVAGTDNVQDPFQPLGNYDLLAAAHLTALSAHLTTDPELHEVYAMVTSRAAKVLGRSAELEFGARADFVVLGAKNVLEAVRGVPERLAVFRAGEPLFSRLGEASSWTS